MFGFKTATALNPCPFCVCTSSNMHQGYHQCNALGLAWAGRTQEQWQEEIRSHVHRCIIRAQGTLQNLRSNLECRHGGERWGTVLKCHVPALGLQKWDRLIAGGSLDKVYDIHTISVPESRHVQLYFSGLPKVR